MAIYCRLLFKFPHPSIPSHTHLTANPNLYSTPLSDYSLMTPLGSSPASSPISLIFLRRSSLLCQTSEGSQFCTWLTSPASFQADSRSPEGVIAHRSNVNAGHSTSTAGRRAGAASGGQGTRELGSASCTALRLVSFLLKSLHLLDLLLRPRLLFLLL